MQIAIIKEIKNKNYTKNSCDKKLILWKNEKDKLSSILSERRKHKKLIKLEVNINYNWKMLLFHNTRK